MFKTSIESESKIQITDKELITISLYKTHIEIIYEDNHLSKEKGLSIKLSEIITIEYNKIDNKYNLIIYTPNMMHYITEGFNSKAKCLESYHTIMECWETYLIWK